MITSIVQARLAAFLDQVPVRVALCVVGLPVTVLSIAFGSGGVYLAFALAQGGASPLVWLTLLPIVVTSLLGFVGLAGAWLRVIRRHDQLSAKLRSLTVTMLWCGVSSASLLLIQELHSLAIGAPLAIAGFLLILGTPARGHTTGGEP